jgi:hypothetical protein
MLSCEKPAEEPALAVGPETDCLPPAFVDCLLDGALEPVLDAAAQRGRQAAKRKRNAGDAGEVAKALLTVTVCDPACGSGSLLVAAARRIARRVAEAREGNQSPDDPWEVATYNSVMAAASSVSKALSADGWLPTANVP